MLRKGVVFSFVTLSLALSSLSFAGPQGDTALVKIQNVVNNNLPADQRTLLQSKVAAVGSALADLDLALTKLDNVVNNNLPVQYREQLKAKVTALKTAIAADLTGSVPSLPPPAPKAGFFCQAACKNADGSAAMQYTKGTSGTNKIIAMQKATETTQASFSCTWGTVEVGCEEASADPTAWTCQSSCINADGSLATQYSDIGQGATSLEALLNSNAATKSKFNCTWGTAKKVCEKN